MSEPTKKAVSEEERRKLVEKMDRDLNELIAEGARKTKERREANPDSDEFRTYTSDELAEELSQNPFFRNTPLNPDEPVPPAFQNVIDWLYETDDQVELARNYKDDGNYNFKMSKYKWAIDSYTEGLKAKCKDLELNAILHANRAACHFRLGNFRSAYKDCVLSRKLKPDHVKAIMRGAECCARLKDYSTAIRWCDAGLMLDSTDAKFLELRAKCVEDQKVQNKEDRKLALRQKKKQKEERELVEAIQSRGIQTDYDPSTDDVEPGIVSPRLLANLDSHHPSGAKVHLNPEDGSLCWPVMFFYPEFKETDFIQEFNESDRLIDHVNYMFGEEADSPVWDKEKKYTPSSISIYFEDQEKETLYRVKKNWSLRKAVTHERYIVKGGIPGFILLADGTDFADGFLKNYKVL